MLKYTQRTSKRYFLLYVLRKFTAKFTQSFSRSRENCSLSLFRFTMTITLEPTFEGFPKAMRFFEWEGRGMPGREWENLEFFDFAFLSFYSCYSHSHLYTLLLPSVRFFCPSVVDNEELRYARIAPTNEKHHDRTTKKFHGA